MGGIGAVGFGVEEIAALRVDDPDPRMGTIMVRSSKEAKNEWSFSALMPVALSATMPCTVTHCALGADLLEQRSDANPEGSKPLAGG
jgi:hypothetical protein